MINRPLSTTSGEAVAFQSGNRPQAETLFITGIITSGGGKTDEEGMARIIIPGKVAAGSH